MEQNKLLNEPGSPNIKKNTFSHLRICHKKHTHKKNNPVRKDPKQRGLALETAVFHSGILCRSQMPAILTSPKLGHEKAKARLKQSYLSTWMPAFPTT